MNIYTANTWFSLCIACFAGLISLEAQTVTSDAPARPNIVLIISDDHRADWMSHKGNPLTPTPNLDKLASEGVSFENAFACSGVCSPSRASILTGRYAHRASTPEIIWTNQSFRKTQTTFAEKLKQAGYTTGYIGKLHLGEDEKPLPGFDYWASFPFVGNFHGQPIWINGVKTPQSGFTDDNIAGLAAEWIEKTAGADAGPFCLVVGLKAPHIPFQYPARMEEALGEVEFPPPETWEQRKPGLRGNAIHAEDFFAAIPAYGNFQNWIKSYTRLALTIDQSVGTIMQALEHSKANENTLLLYTTDQGYSLGEFGLSEKHYAYEQIMRVPMIIRYPEQVRAGAEFEEMVLNIDIAPTLLDFADAPPLNGMDGTSWRPLFSGTTEGWRDRFFFSFWNEWHYALPPMQALRTERYKLIDYQEKPIKELYDLKADPFEQTNLYGNPNYTEIQAQMESDLEEEKAAIGFTPRKVKQLKDVYLLGPIDESDLDALLEKTKTMSSGSTLSANGRTYDWTKVPMPLHYEAVGLKPGQKYLLGVEIERNTDYDPYVTFEFFEPGGFLQWNKNAIPLSAHVGAERIWYNAAYSKAEQLPYLPIGRFNNKCNYPLTDSTTWAIFKGQVPKNIAAVEAEVISPQNTIILNR